MHGSRTGHAVGRALYQAFKSQQAVEPVLGATIDTVFAYLSHYSEKSGYRFTRSNTIYIAPTFHGKGVGRALMTDLVALAREADLHVLMAGIEATNEPSIRLHASLGYVAAGTAKELGFKFGRWLDLLTMQLTLPNRPPG